ncbi:PREDICTED: cytochrome c oxidase protein 20 homolog [Pterocles gutturalis]|uniref:cytochrome c oxidase protein 20 homolog n=1 Tax=Pterocles gutturalis TaxID=240206 RepID=UPI0005291E8F|nr:PREDICTED: cytochrome c oxidase protein 20 homolog [Pterocles gutturalis]
MRVEPFPRFSVSPPAPLERSRPCEEGEAEDGLCGYPARGEEGVNPGGVASEEIIREQHMETASFKLLGFLDVKKVPCARESVLYGSVGSLVVGLGHFLVTSRVRRSCDFAVGGFICTMLGYWFYCRYNLAQQRIRQRMIKEGMRNRILFEGTSLDPERKRTGNEGSDS